MSRVYQNLKPYPPLSHELSRLDSRTILVHRPVDPAGKELDLRKKISITKSMLALKKPALRRTMPLLGNAGGLRPAVTLILF